MKVTWKRRFWNNEQGTILAEALVVIPVVTIFAVGVLEFGNVFWQRHLLEVAVRDAARYWARCRPIADGSAFMPCSQTIAKNIALYGNPTGTGPLRIPSWDDPAEISITPTTPPTNPARTDTVIVRGEMSYNASPLFGMLELGGITIAYSHEERYYGW